MKKTPTVGRVTDPAKSVEGIKSKDEKEGELSNGSLNLSPERIMAGASTRTALLNEILAHQEVVHEIRHWGINE